MSGSDFADQCHALAIKSSCKEEDFSDLFSLAEYNQDVLAQGWCCLGKSKYFLLIGDIAQSLEWATRTECHFARSRCEEGMAYLYLERGKTLAIMGDLSEGRTQMQSAIEQARAIKNQRLEAIALGSLAFSYGEQDDPEPYAALSREALAIFEAIQDQRMVASILANLGGALVRLGQDDEAQACYDRSLALAIKHNIAFVEALCLAGQGAIACRQGHLEKGIHSYEKSNQILSIQGNHFQIARHYFLAGKHARAALSLEQAALLFHKSRELIETHHFGSLAWQVYEELAQLTEQQGRSGEALTWLRKRIQARERLLDDRTEERLRVLRHSHRMEILRQQAASSAARSEQLESTNRNLQDALLREQTLRQQVEVLATTDSLTGLLNRRSWEQRAYEACRRNHRLQHNVVVALLDIDFFKRINDTFGHGVGDEVLVQFAQQMRKVFRETDAIGRYGGEEFCLLFEGYSVNQVKIACERLLHALHAQPVSSACGPIFITVSIGLCQADQVVELLKNADRALYQAKNTGRDCIVVDTDGIPDHLPSRNIAVAPDTEAPTDPERQE